MLLSSSGVVLGSIKYSDSSLITKVFTEERGLVSLISNRGKGKTSKNSILKQPFILIEFICYFKDKSNVHRVKELSIAKGYNSNSTDIIKSSVSFFIAEFLSKTIKEEEQNTGLFQFFYLKSMELNQCSKVNPMFVLNFLIELLAHLGIEPHTEDGDIYFDLIGGTYTNTQPSHKNYFLGEEAKLVKELIENGGTLNKQERKTCMNAIIDYYSCQLQQEIKLKSHEVLEVVFA